MGLKRLLKLRDLDEEIRRYVHRHQFDGLNITLTMKQKVGDVWLDELMVDRNVRYFKNILNKKTFGNSYRRFGKELKSLFIKEWSEDKRHHIHSIIQQPNHIDEVTFQSLISDSWRRTLFGYEQIHIEKPTSPQREIGWLDYIMKTTTKKSLSEAIDWDNSNCFH